MDSRGLLLDDRKFREEYKAEFAWPHERASGLGLREEQLTDVVSVIRATKASVLIGTSGQPGIFDEHVVRAMCEHCERPQILPFSNPTDNSEGRPEEIISASDGRALVATGSPFPDVQYGGRRIKIGQGNNVYVFPGVGLGALVSGAGKVTESMFTAAAQALAEQVHSDDLDSGSLYPPISDLRTITARIAFAVARSASEQGLCPTHTDDELEARVAKWMWEPRYATYVKV